MAYKLVPELGLSLFDLSGRLFKGWRHVILPVRLQMGALCKLNSFPNGLLGKLLKNAICAVYTADAPQK